MSRQFKYTVLAILVAVLALVVYRNYIKAPENVAGLQSNEIYTPIGVENPAVRLDILEKTRASEYSGSHRDIFSQTLPPPEVPATKPGGPGKNAQPLPPADTGPPPLTLPLKFFGYASDPRTGRRRAFFTDGDDVFIAAEGETLLTRFRVLRIGNSSAEVEEISSKRRTTAILEELPQS
jgi:hypothetical protein